MIEKIVAESRSYRSFDESRKISKEELVELINIARLCPSAMNRQPIKYKLVYSREEVEEFLAITKWGGMLPDLTLPPDGKHPQAFIIVCCDSDLCENIDSARFDAGIVSQTIMLSACEKGLGGCILAAFDKTRANQILSIDKRYTPIVALALGKPDENVIICNTSSNGSIAYFRDVSGTHFVPKRSSEELILE